MKALKDWSKEITDIATIEDEAVLTLYSEMLATAHDINYTVPDDQLIETEDAGALRKVIPALHAGIIEAHATAQTAAAEKTSAKAKASTAKPEAIKKKKTAVAKTETTTKAPTKPASKAAQKVKTKEPETMATPTAKKTAKKAAPAAKKAAPAKGAAKKGTAKKAAAANARKPATGGGERCHQGAQQGHRHQGRLRAWQARGRRDEVQRQEGCRLLQQGVAAVQPHRHPPLPRIEGLHLDQVTRAGHNATRAGGPVHAGPLSL
jgi:outer membrane biosynthesis protein TonB